MSGGGILLIGYLIIPIVMFLGIITVLIFLIKNIKQGKK